MRRTMLRVLATAGALLLLLSPVGSASADGLLPTPGGGSGGSGTDPVTGVVGGVTGAVGDTIGEVLPDGEGDGDDATPPATGGGDDGGSGDGGGDDGAQPSTPDSPTEPTQPIEPTQPSEPPGHSGGDSSGSSGSGGSAGGSTGGDSGDSAGSAGSGSAAGDSAGSAGNSADGGSAADAGSAGDASAPSGSVSGGSSDESGDGSVSAMPSHPQHSARTTARSDSMDLKVAREKGQLPPGISAEVCEPVMDAREGLSGAGKPSADRVFAAMPGPARALVPQTLRLAVLTACVKQGADGGADTAFFASSSADGPGGVGLSTMSVLAAPVLLLLGVGGLLYRRRSRS